MKNYLVAALALGLAAALVIAHPSKAHAQQYAAQIACQIPMDGGTGSVTNTCGPVLLNYQPTTVHCDYAPNKDSTQGIISILTSGDGIHFGCPVSPTTTGVVAIPDGGVAKRVSCGLSTSAFGPLAVSTKAEGILDAVLSPTDPYLYAEITATAKADGGASGDGINCYFSVVQSQTLHAVKGKAQKPKGTILNPAGVKPEVDGQ